MEKRAGLRFYKAIIFIALLKGCCPVLSTTATLNQYIIPGVKPIMVCLAFVVVAAVTQLVATKGVGLYYHNTVVILYKVAVIISD
jgi:hypothetical protein